jgi:23S rRNA (uracil1939-C5)-methyltransferase
VSYASGDVLLVVVIGSRELPGSKHFVSEITKAHPEIRTIVLNYNHEQTSMILGKRDKVLFGRGYITDRIGDITFRISSRSFYQVNPRQTEVLYKTALDLADIREGETVLDACCGIGTISLLAAGRAEHVTGVEISPEAIRDAKSNAVNNGIENISFYATDISEFLRRINRDFDVVILDPPRSGMGEDAMKAIRNMMPDRIVYVSCNPVTQAEDLRTLKDIYNIRKIIPVDMFPFTKHIETVCLLTHTN